MKEPIRKEGHCLLCGKIAKYKEWSPDGPPDFFCSIKHFKINWDYFHARGIGWRAAPLQKYEK